jgi:hypothetical protein
MASRTGRVVLLALAAVAILAVSIPGQPSYPARLPDKGQNFGCLYCHYTTEGGGAFNSFGRDFQANGHVYDPSLGAKDSDGDGFTNKQEFDSVPVTNPGDSKSFPGTDEPAGDNTSYYYLMLIVVIVLVIGVVLVSVRTRARASKGGGPKDPSKLSRRERRRAGRGQKGRAGR